MEKVSAACAMDWSIKLEIALRSKNPVRAVEAILETGEKLEQWSKEPKPAIAVYNLFDLVPEEDRLFYNTILLRLVDAFCFGDKLVKVAVVRVFLSMFKRSRRKNRSDSATWFLSKARVYNHLEILKRVKNVYDKGDTESKSLALILFGCWRDFASEFAPLRYLILRVFTGTRPIGAEKMFTGSFGALRNGESKSQNLPAEPASIDRDLRRSTGGLTRREDFPESVVSIDKHSVSIDRQV